MEILGGSMILHPALAGELKIMQESSGFETPGAYLKHLLALDEKFQQLGTTLDADVELSQFANTATNQDGNEESAKQARTESIGVQAKLCSCSDSIIDGSRNEVITGSDSESVQQSDSPDESDSISVYGNTKEVVTEDAVITRRRRKLKQTETVQNAVGQKTEIRRKTNQGQSQEYSCVECGAKFTQESYFLHHMKRHGREGKIQCQYCDHSYLIPSKLEKHVSALHPEHAPSPRDKRKEEKRFVCTTCGVASETMSAHSMHLRLHADEKPYACDLCQENFKYLTSLGNHKLRVHNQERPYPCHVCGRSFKFPGHLKEHRVVHTGEKRYKCPECDKGFTAHNSLRNHKIRCHEIPGSKPYQCPHCEKGFAVKYTLESHIERKHVNPDKYKRKPYKFLNPPLERSFQCHLCGKAFGHLCNLRSHTEKHTSGKWFKCTQCDKEYKDKTSLKDHVFRVHENPGFKAVKCPLCEQRFTKKGSLPKHIKRKHKTPQHEKYKRDPNRPRKPPPERSFQCDICDRAFRYLSNLRRHSVTHSGEQRFECAQCDKVYRDNATLKTHILVSHENSGVKMFPCLHCDKKFAYKTSLSKHIKTFHEDPERTLKIPAHVEMTSVVSQGFKGTTAVKSSPLLLPVL